MEYDSDPFVLHRQQLEKHHVQSTEDLCAILRAVSEATLDHSFQRYAVRKRKILQILSNGKKK
jgi:hypothetical protein